MRIGCFEIRIVRQKRKQNLAVRYDLSKLLFGKREGGKAVKLMTPNEREEERKSFFEKNRKGRNMERKVDMYGCITINGKIFDVGRELHGEIVTVNYDHTVTDSRGKSHSMRFVRQARFEELPKDQGEELE